MGVFKAWLLLSGAMGAGEGGGEGTRKKDLPKEGWGTSPPENFQHRELDFPHFQTENV
jgi:hypothetical protein